MINIENIELIKKLRKILDYNNYDIINQSVRGSYEYFLNPLPDYNAVSLKLNNLNIDNKELFKLLLLGDEVDTKKLINLFGKEFVDMLVNLGISYEKDGYVKTNNYIIVSYMDKYFLINTPFRNPNCTNKNSDTYIGIDSYRLSSNIINHKVNSILDLCTGSGIQGICASPFAEKITEIELNPVAYNVAKFNVILNDLDHKIEVKNASLYDSVKNERFDVIYSNPPFIPVPKTIDFPICGDGGEDGLDIIKKIITGYKKHLNSNGYGIMIGEVLGDKNTPFLKDVVKEILNEGYESQLIITGKNTSDCQISRTLDLAINIYDTTYNRDKIFKKWYDMYQEMGATHYYSFLLKVRKVTDSTEKIKLIDLTHSWNTDSIPKLNGELNVVKLNTIYGVTKNGEIVSSINQNTLDILNVVNNKRNINEIYETLLYGNNQQICMRHREEVIDDIINLCDLMEQSGVISK